jgi:hypothetical protein
LTTSGKAKRLKETTRNDRKRGEVEQQDETGYDGQHNLGWNIDANMLHRSDEEAPSKPSDPKRKKRQKPWEMVDNVRLLTETAAKVMWLILTLPFVTNTPQSGLTIALINNPTKQSPHHQQVEGYDDPFCRCLITLRILFFYAILF